MNGYWRPERIEDHALIGDGETAVLVHRDGTIDWLCLPRFDSDACFAALLGDEDNGGWWLYPEGGVVRTERRYLDHTLVLETLFETADGIVAVTDFMPTDRGEAPDIVRIVEGRRGRVPMVSELALRFDHGRTHPLVRSVSDHELIAIAGPNAVALRFDAEIVDGGRCFESRFTIAEGERRCFTMTWFRSYDPEPKRVDPPLALQETSDYWHRWAKSIALEGDRQPMVIRSLMVLKALIHRPTGGMIAAPTSSLPERAGGGRNWDYRFCWLRDATFTLLAFLRVGLHDEAFAWIQWMRRAVAGEPIDVQPFYALDGGRRAAEWEADWLSGFGGAQPVRFGNEAVYQCQLDIYGEVLDALALADAQGLAKHGHPLARLLIAKLMDVWEMPDAGIWESRGPLLNHTYSKAMCWVAFDRAAGLLADEAPEEAARCRELAEEVHALVMEHGYDPEQQSFVRAFEDRALDAAVLRLPLVGFIDANDERMVRTVEAIERELMRDGLVLRYATEDTDDGVGGEEGAFLAASCWLADVYSLQGRRQDAEELLDRVIATANDLGLVAEEISFKTGQMLGNFPQALSHVAMVNCALNLAGVGGARSRHQK